MRRLVTGVVAYLLTLVGVGAVLAILAVHVTWDQLPNVAMPVIMVAGLLATLRIGRRRH